MGIKQGSVQDMPREKLIKNGNGTLTDAELIAILLVSGNKKESAFSLANSLLIAVGHNLTSLAKLSFNELKSFNGIGDAKAIAVIAAFELASRKLAIPVSQVRAINSSEDAYKELRIHFYELAHEEFWVLYLNRANKVIEKKFHSKGGISGTVADIRIILKGAILHSASNIIVAHNHPSGKLDPSVQDLNLTRKLKESAALMDIQLIDHLIIYNEQFFSFADQGKL